MNDDLGNPHKVAFIYLMVNGDHTRFKIGFSIDPFRRRKQFATKIDLETSMQVSCDAGDVRRLETVLHAWFADFRIDRNLVDDIYGRTEWFDFRCWDSVLSYLAANRGWLRCSEPARLDLSKTIQGAQRLPVKKLPPRRLRAPLKSLSAELGNVGSMAELMAKAETSTGEPIINKSLTLCLSHSALREDNEVGFGRLLWEAGALQKLGIIKLDHVDLFTLSFTFTRLNSEKFDTDSLYALKPISASKSARCKLRKPISEQ
jgi:hypothetical protein